MNLTFDIIRMSREFTRTIREELDFRNEFRNAEEFRNHIPKGVSIPDFCQQYVRKSVLVESRVEGMNPTDLQPAERKKVVERLGQMLLQHLSAAPIYHYDLHPGNIRVLPGGRIVLLDFGHMGRLDSEQREQATALFQALRLRDPARTVKVMECMGEPSYSYDSSRFLQSLTELFAQPVSSVDLMLGLTKQAGMNGLELPGFILELQKAITTFEGTACLLDSEFKIETAVRRWAARSAITRIFGGR